MREVYDVAIIGAGPAGALAAALLTEYGARVVCVNKPKVSMGSVGALETTNPKAMATFRSCQLELRPETALRRIHSTVSTWGNATPAIRPGIQNPHGGSYVLDRNRFHTLLLDGLKKLKIDVREGHVNFVREILEGWEISTKKQSQKRLRARYLIDASGRNSHIPMKLGLKRTLLDRLVARHYILPTEEEDYCLRLDSLENGWIFSICSDQYRMISVYTDGSLVNRRLDSLGKHCFRNSVASSVAISEVVSTRDFEKVLFTYFLSASSSTLRRAAGSSFFICGDAASTYDPLSSSGIAEAIASVEDAVATILETEKGNDKAWMRFEHERQSRFKAYLSKRKSVYESEHRWQTAPFWLARQSKLTY